MRILLVEDNPADVRLLQEALRAGGTRHTLEVARNGAEALTRLRGGAPPPEVVLLDLNLPGISGHEVLADVRQDGDFAQLPVFVLSSYEDEDEVHAAAGDIQADGYLAKPSSLEECERLVRVLETFWARRQGSGLGGT